MCRREVRTRIAARAAMPVARSFCGFLGSLFMLCRGMEAQVSPSRCIGDTQGFRLSPGLYVSPQAGAIVDGRYLLLGWPFLKFRPGLERGVEPDTNGAGLMVSRTTAPTVVQQPIPGLLMASPRIRHVDARTVEVLFSANPTRATPDSRPDSLVIWSAALRRGEWMEVRRVVALPEGSQDAREIVGDGVEFNGELVAPYIARGGQSPREEVVLIRGGAGRWRHEPLVPDLFGASYVDVAVFRDTLFVVVAAASNGERGLPREFGLWLTRETQAGWSEPQLIIKGNGLTTIEPRLLATPRDLVLAWIERTGSDQLLRWRGVSDTGKSQTLERPVNSVTSKGWGALAHLLVATRDDSTSQILALTPEKGEVLWELPTIFGAPPTLLGSSSQFEVIAVAMSPTLVAVPVWLSVRELRCRDADSP
jgi:hypothetical protein